MTPERQAAVVTDSGCSLWPEDPLVEELSIKIAPLQVTFIEDGKPVVYGDYDLSPDDFYQKMASSKSLPTTSGAITGPLIEIYKELAENTQNIISIHITSKHSQAYSSAVLAARKAKEEIPELSIEVIDSRQLSFGLWFPVAQAARLAQEGKSLEEIKMAVLETIPQVKLYAALASLENLKKGGRLSKHQAFLASVLQLKLIIGLDGGGEQSGEILPVSRVRTFKQAKKQLVELVKQEEEIVKLAVLHTNEKEVAEEVRNMLGEFYKQEIIIREAGSALGVHAGPGAVGIAFQRAKKTKS